MMSESLTLLLAWIVAMVIFAVATTIIVKHIVNEIKDMAFDMVSNLFIESTPFSTTSCSLLSMSCPTQINASLSAARYRANEGEALLARAELVMKRQ
jgi:hypothetical protein